MSRQATGNASPQSQGSTVPTRPSTPCPGLFGRLSTNKQEVRHTRETAEVALSVATTVVKLLKEFTSDAGVPGLSEGFAVVAEVLTKVKAMNATIKGIDELNERIKNLHEMLREFQTTSDEAELPDSMRADICRMVKRWEETGEKLGGMKKRKGVMRFLRSEVDADELARLVKVISDSLQDCLTSSVWRIDRNVHHTQKRVDDLDRNVGIVGSKVDKLALQHDDSLIPRGAKNAQYNANAARNGCLDGTRRRFLDQVDAWVAITFTQKPPPSQILWVSALAGAGKTSVAFTVVERYKAKGQIVGNFFCARGDAECGNSNMVFPTLATQLCSFYPPLREIIAAALRADPTIVDAAPSRQLEELIVRPLEQVRDKFTSPAIVVIDALDECQDLPSSSPSPSSSTSSSATTSGILSALDHHIDRLAPIQFILTSRPEPFVSMFLEKSRGKALSRVTTQLDLHAVESETVSDDVGQYFMHGLTSNNPFQVPPGWPFMGNINTLTSLAGDLFIWASTAVRFILDPAYGDPVGRLERLLKMGADAPSREPTILLDTLYAEVVTEAQSAFPLDTEELKDRLLSILGAIVVAEEPLSVATIADLLPDVDVYKVRNSLSRLYSVLSVPQDDSLPVRIIHPTFREYILQPIPGKPELFDLKPADQHAAMASRCLNTMDLLEYDIARIQDRLLSKKEIPHLSSKVVERIPPHLSYACRRWSAHLQSTVPPSADRLYVSLQNFLDHRFLFWLEACSLLEVQEGTIHALDAALHACQRIGGTFETLIDTLKDYRRFAVKYATGIDEAPLQLYDSVLAVTPSDSVVARKYGSSLGHKLSLVVQHGAIADWGSSIDSFASHDTSTHSGIRSVAFSPDGVFFATTGVDQTIRIWRALTRTMVLVIEGVKDDVYSLAYSPDGTSIVSGSKGGLVQMWDAVSGTHIRDFEGHSGEVIFVSYVAGGTQIFFASSQGEIKLWDASDGRVIFQHASPNVEWRRLEVGVSPDAAMMTYYEGDALYLHSLSTQQLDTLDLPGKCWATTFSSDGKHVAAATHAGIWIWSLPDKLLVCQLDDLKRPYCLAFSSDAAQIACGCEDGSVRLWRLESKRAARVFHGPADLVNSIAWSADDAILVSVGGGGLVSVWDTAAPSISSSDLQQDLPSDQHSPGPARFGLFEYNGSQAIHDLPPSLEHNLTNEPGMPVIEGGPAAKLYSSRAARYCDNLVEPSPEFPLQPNDMYYPILSWAYLLGRLHHHHTALHSPIVFSPDGAMLAYVTSDNDIRICSLRTQMVVATLTGHTHVVRSAVFSPGGALLASGDEDGTVNLWDASTGSLLSSYKQETRIRDITFSSDNRFVASCALQRGVCVAKPFTKDTVKHFLTVAPEVDIARVAFNLSGEHVLALDDNGPSILVWNISSGTCVCRFSLRDNSWVTSLNFLPDDTGIILNSHGNAPCALTLWNPGDRRWPAYHVDKTGWIYAQGPEYTRRLGWLPQDWRYTLCSEGTCVYVWDSSRRVVVEIDLSRALQDAGLSVTQ